MGYSTPTGHHRNHSKGLGYDRGHRILDVKCYCGKISITRAGYKQHLQVKHPKKLRQMKKSGEWEQLEYDWPYDKYLQK